MTYQMLLVLCIAVILLPIASFANVVIDRLPVELDEPNEYGETWDTRPWIEAVGGRSRCSTCSAPVRPIDNIPIVSYLVLRGRCRTCGTPYGAFHLLVEVLVPLVGAAMAWVLIDRFGVTWVLVPFLFLVPVGAVVSVIDLRTLIVPTAVIWPATALSVLMLVVTTIAIGQPAWLLGALLGVCTLSGPLFAIWWLVPAGMGFGDVRLTVLLGLNVGYAALAAGFSLGAGALLGVLCLFVSAIVGIVMALPFLGAGRRKVPFGPALVIGALVCVTFAAPLLEPFVS